MADDTSPALLDPAPPIGWVPRATATSAKSVGAPILNTPASSAANASPIMQGSNGTAPPSDSISSPLAGLPVTYPPQPAESVKRMVLDKIASGEASSYNELYKGGSFSGFNDHPRIRQVITEGPHKGETSDAAGKYQFLSSTWDSQKAKLGLKDFSPQSQDAAAWDLANSTYKSTTGRDLLSDASQGKVDYTKLAGQWPSLANANASQDDWKSAATKAGLSSQEIASLGPQEIAQFKQYADVQRGGTNTTNTTRSGTREASPTSTDAVVEASPAAGAFRDEMKLKLLQGMFPQHSITAVEYDPWKYVPNLSGKVDVNRGVS